jgi:hypothetical protein
MVSVPENTQRPQAHMLAYLSNHIHRQPLTSRPPTTHTQTEAHPTDRGGDGGGKRGSKREGGGGREREREREREKGGDPERGANVGRMRSGKIPYLMCSTLKFHKADPQGFSTTFQDFLAEGDIYNQYHSGVCDACKTMRL